MEWVQVFSVMVVEPAGEATWIVKGRALQDFDLDDVLYVLEDHVGVPPTPEGFSVEEIVAYRRKLPFVSAGLAAELKLRGGHGDQLRGAETLYKQATARNH